MTDAAALVDRIGERIDALAAITDPGAGVTRLAYSRREREAHALLHRWASEAGLESTSDPAGNSVVVVRPGEPYVLLGSHLDSVPQGGAYDGAGGVVAALEAARMVDGQAGAFGLRVVAFAGEEGARFGKPCIGSSIACGQFHAAAATSLVDAGSVTLAAAASALGLTVAEVPAWIDRQSTVAFLEAHIEQGRVLEGAGERLGVVDVVAGSVRLRMSLTGRAEHSGTTPMDIRTDALAAAAEVVLLVERHGGATPTTRGTVGRLDVRPNTPTTVPGGVDLVVDVRDTAPDQQREAAEAIVAGAAAACARRGVSLDVQRISEHAPVALSRSVGSALRDACAESDVRWRVMASGAGHDAAIVAGVVPAGLLFIPCRDGLSHAPQEMASREDIFLAARVLARAVEALAARM